MEYLQYLIEKYSKDPNVSCFKPCYKWNTFNTLVIQTVNCLWLYVLNLVISGIPSIQRIIYYSNSRSNKSFKPCYKWNTFNTRTSYVAVMDERFVLNLVISGIPSIQKNLVLLLDLPLLF